MEHRRIARAALTAGWSAAEQVRSETIRRRKREKAEAAKREAGEVFQQLMTLTPKERRGLIEVFPDYWTWALALRFSEGSLRKAAHKPRLGPLEGGNRPREPSPRVAAVRP